MPDVVGAGDHPQLDGQLAGWGVGLQDEDGRGGDGGHAQVLGVEGGLRSRAEGRTISGQGRAGGPGRPDVASADVTRSPTPREGLLARALVELADTLVADFDVVELLTLLADRCVEVLDVAAAGLLLAGPCGDLRMMASSSEAMRVLELFELQAQEGPCLDCYRSGQAVVNQDLASVNGRWPRFAPEALAAGFRSVHALPMRLRGSVIGALNLFHAETGEMRSADIDAAQALADIATIAILQHRATLEAQVVNQQLQHALNSRIVIEQAKGMAFTALRNHARNHNLLLVVVAEAVIGGSVAPSALGRVSFGRSLPDERGVAGGNL